MQRQRPAGAKQYDKARLFVGTPSGAPRHLVTLVGKFHRRNFPAVVNKPRTRQEWRFAAGKCGRASGRKPFLRSNSPHQSGELLRGGYSLPKPGRRRNTPPRSGDVTRRFVRRKISPKKFSGGSEQATTEARMAVCRRQMRPCFWPQAISCSASPRTKAGNCCVPLSRSISTTATRFGIEQARRWCTGESKVKA